MNANSSTSSATTVILGCSKCGATLPDEARFCLQCGKPVAVAASKPEVVEVVPPEKTRPRRRSSHLYVWIVLALLIAGVLWLLTSESSTAQDIQAMMGWKHDETILDEGFSVGAHTFRFYKFSLPEGSLNVDVVGDFSATADAPSTNIRKSKSQALNSAANQDQPDNSIEVYVLSEPAFTIWQNGYGTSSVYDSGKVSQGKVQADVPAGAGIYYLVFSNKAAANTPKSIHATVVLRYKSWIPEWYRRVKERFWNWVES
jgi:hypothetical protein